MISVIVPVYNTQDYIEFCIKSIIDQKCDKEIIIVDDGSTDGSSALCDKLECIYKEVRVIHKNNGGLSSARNIGLNEAKGEYIGFVDSDDCLLPNIYSILLELGGKCDVMCMGRRITFEDGHAKKLFCFDTPYYIGQEEYYKSVLEYRNMNISVCDKLFKREMFDDVRFSEGYYNEDILILPNLIKKTNRVLVSGKEGYMYRQHTGSITKSFNPNYLKTYYALKSVRKFTIDNYPQLIDSYEAFEDVYLNLLYGLYQMHGTKYRDAGKELKSLYNKRFMNIMLNKKVSLLTKAESIFLKLGIGRYFYKAKDTLRVLYEK